MTLHENKPIILAGMMGTGKSHIGKLLAERLSLPFYDSDKVIEERGGLTIPEIFELYGEARFRESETKTIIELLGQGACVIATGGGALTNDAVLEAVKAQSHSIWLHADLETLMERLSQSKNRPLLQNDNPKAILEDLLEKRESLYAQMDIAINTGAGNADAVLNEIVDKLGNLK
ncbi:MAG: shikimate kinase [Alphaproteobacteria bacterium]